MSHQQQQQQQSVFQEGALPVEFINVEGRPAPPLPPSYGKNKGLSVLPPLLARLPPKPLLIALPRAHGLYPLVLVFHGFLLRSNHYSQLLQHIASHGFVAIAPQMYDFAGADASQEIADAAAIIDWLPDGLAQFFPDDLSHVRPDFDKLALIGHSRGAKVAFGLALGLSKTSLKLQLHSWIGSCGWQRCWPTDHPSHSQILGAFLRFEAPNFDRGFGPGLAEKERSLPSMCP